MKSFFTNNVFYIKVTLKIFSW